jgi:transketolase
MLLYALLHLTGYDVTLDDLRKFRQLGSRTPGHPEFGHTAGVEVTSGPLGQGFANGIGMALGHAMLSARLGPGNPLEDVFVYGIVSDGDLMEGVAAGRPASPATTSSAASSTSTTTTRSPSTAAPPSPSPART